jgi:hypothetical protein
MRPQGIVEIEANLRVPKRRAQAALALRIRIAALLKEI